MWMFLAQTSRRAWGEKRGRERTQPDQKRGPLQFVIPSSIFLQTKQTTPEPAPTPVHRNPEGGCERTPPRPGQSPKIVPHSRFLGTERPEKCWRGGPFAPPCRRREGSGHGRPRRESGEGPCPETSKDTEGRMGEAAAGWAPRGVRTFSLARFDFLPRIRNLGHRIRLGPKGVKLGPPQVRNFGHPIRSSGPKFRSFGDQGSKFWVQGSKFLGQGFEVLGQGFEILAPGLEVCSQSSQF